MTRRALVSRGMIACVMLALASPAWVKAAEPDRKIYWDVKDVRPGMKGMGKTVFRGVELEEFGVEVLGVMKDVNPGRDMVLCRLSGCGLDHSGVIQGMSGSPVYIDGKLLGAVAFAWEFGKDPIAGITPFSQMVEYVRATSREKGASREIVKTVSVSPSLFDPSSLDALEPMPVAGGAVGGMRPITMPLAASGFSARALAVLGERLAPLGMAPMASGKAAANVVERDGDRPLVPGSPLSVAMVTGDFDLSGIGTVTHVEGDRVYGFGHPMFGLGDCEFPMMSGYIHTVYPRVSVSSKMGSPLKVVGVLDTDVSTAVSGRLGAKPDMLPMTVSVKVGRAESPRAYKLEVVREPNLLATLVLTVLTNAIDTDGNLPDELTARVGAKITIEGKAPIIVADTFSGPRLTGPMGPVMLFGPISNIVGLLARNPLGPLRIQSIDCDIDIRSGRMHAEVESVRLASDRLEPGQTLCAIVSLKPYKGDRQTVEIDLPLPVDIAEGVHEVSLCDYSQSMRRRFRNDPQRLEPRDVESMIDLLRFQSAPKRTSLYLHVPLADRGIAVHGQTLPNLPSSARSVLASGRQTAQPPVRADLVKAEPTPWVVEGFQSLRFTVVKDSGLSLRD
jgi:SpoIVB peptidase S55